MFEDKISIRKITWNPNIACNQSNMSNVRAFAGFLDDGHNNELMFLRAATAAHIWHIEKKNLLHFRPK